MTLRGFSARQVGNPLALAMLASGAALATASRFLEIAPTAEEHWFTGILVRVALDPYTQCMIWIFLTLSLYSLFQAIGTGVDRARLLGGKGSGLASFVAGRFDAAPFDPTAPSLMHEVAEEQLSLNLAPVQFGIWIMPLLGFIGTVLGISSAIGGLEQMLPNGSGMQAEDSIRTVMSGLRFKFNTTFVGLSLVIPLMLFMVWLRALGRRNILLARQLSAQ